MKKAGLLVAVCLFFLVSVSIQLSSIYRKDMKDRSLETDLQKTTYTADSVETAVRTKAQPVRDPVLLFLFGQIKNNFPVINAAAMNGYDLEMRSNWITALFSDAFLINSYAAHNGQEAILNENMTAEETMNQTGKSTDDSDNFPMQPGAVDFIAGEFYFEDGTYPEEDTDSKAVLSDSDLLKHNQQIIRKLKQVKTSEYLLQNFYAVNPTTTTDSAVFNVEKLLNKDCTMVKEPDKPQILIYHTHGASESFSDSRKGNKEDSIIGVGSRLAEILSEKYGYRVIHDTTPYDRIDGKIDRNKAYNMAEASVENTLKENPTIEVLIDLHRDASGNGQKRVTTVNGKPTAQVMFFNGLSRNLNGNIAYLKNPNLQGNLAFSLKLKIAAMEKYQDFTTRIFLKGYRYNLHLREKSLLIELGNEKNTLEEALNAMEPLAETLNSVLTK